MKLWVLYVHFKICVSNNIPICRTWPICMGGEASSLAGLGGLFAVLSQLSYTS